MTGNLYEMAGCVFCERSKQALENEINSGLVVVKPASEAGGRFNGYPAFENTLNGRVHLGAVNSYQELVEKLDIIDISIENYQYTTASDWYIGVL